MAIRVFLCPWSEQQTAEGLEIDNPIDAYLRDKPLSAPAIGINYYARLSQAHRPDKLYMLKAMRGNITAAEWTTLDDLPGVRMVPPGAFNKATSSIGNSVRNQIYQAMDALGVPRSVYDSAATLGGFLRNLLNELDPGVVSFGPWELEPNEWA